MTAAAAPTALAPTGALPPAPTRRPRVLLMQDGARLHYGVARALQRAGMLERMVTDWYVRPGSAEGLVAGWVERLSPNLGRKMAGRRCGELDPRLIRSRPWATLWERLNRRRFRLSGRYFQWVAARQAEWLAQTGFGRADVLAGFVRSLHPRLLDAAADAGLAVTADQMIAPAAEEIRQLRLQLTRWPGWAEGGAAELDDHALAVDLERRTWARADRLTCASDYVRDGLIAEGVPADRIAVLPYPFEPDPAPAVPPAARRGGPPVVGFVGSVDLRKGAPYFAEAAARLRGRARFVMVGPVRLSETGRRRLAEAGVEAVGPVPRSQVAERLAGFDVFFFPSTCEGSAGVLMEAMAAGLPVVTSPNSGTVARDGLDGFVLPYDDAAGQAERLGGLLDDASRRAAMGGSAAGRAREFSVDAYAAGLARVVREAAAGR